MGERLYVQQDANGDVTAVVDGKTGSPTLGQVQERYVEDPYGQPSFLDPTSWLVHGTGANGTSFFNWVYLHQGGRYDSVSGLFNFRNRDYSPTLGRWMRVDPLGYRAGDTNLYRYVGNSPLTFADPFGLADVPMPIKLPPGFTGFSEPIMEGDKQVGWRNPTNGQRIRWEGSSKHGPHWDWQGVKDSKGRNTKIRMRASGKGVDPKDVKNLKTIRPGCARASALAAALGTTVIVGGVAYAYGEYVGIGETKGMDKATKVGLAQSLQWADRHTIEGAFPHGLLPGLVFDVVDPLGRTIHISIVEKDGLKYLTAWYTRERWNIFAGSYTETVDLITPKDEYRVWNVKPKGGH